MTTATPAMEKRITQIQKMLNQASCPGATSAEAEAFMGHAQRLIEKYNITETMLNAEEAKQKGDEPILRRTVYQRTSTDRYGIVKKIAKMPTWMLTLAGGVASANRCKHWYSSSRSHGHIGAAGTDANLKSFELLMPFLVAEVDRLYKEEKPGWLDRSEGKRWANSFRNGCASRIAQRLREARKQAAEEMRAEASGKALEDRYKEALEAGDTEALLALDKEPQKSEFALALVETALVRLDNDEVRTKQWVKDNMSLRSGSARNRYGSNSGAFGAGRAAGSRANISGPRGRING